jgi:pheromone a factor receptor
MLAGVEILGTIPLGSFVMSLSIKAGLSPWVSWADVHSHYSEIMQIPSNMWKDNSSSAVGPELFRWSLVLCAFLFFAFFGFANEARKNYRRAYWSLAGLFNYSPLPGTSIGSSHACVGQPR